MYRVCAVATMLKPITNTADNTMLTNLFIISSFGYENPEAVLVRHVRHGLQPKGLRNFLLSNSSEQKSSGACSISIESLRLIKSERSVSRASSIREHDFEREQIEFQLCDSGIAGLDYSLQPN